jgi:isoleucyl-tRNA synthetase
MYRNLTGFEGDRPPGDGIADSVHLTDFPHTHGEWRDPDVLRDMEQLRRLVEAGLAARTEAHVPTRQPLRAAIIEGPPLHHELEAIFSDELNVKVVEYVTGDRETVTLDTNITDGLRLEWIAREISRKVNELRRQAKLQVDDRIVLAVEASGDVARSVDAQRAWLMGETLATDIVLARGEALAEWSGAIAGEACWLGVRR